MTRARTHRPPTSIRPARGVRVLELAQIMAGPTCGAMLADSAPT
jgi:crotonobetainyl-CoA:carnitine CoA-transferase CaiB-like acyl-CoA transferase